MVYAAALCCAAAARNSSRIGVSSTNEGSSGRVEFGMPLDGEDVRRTRVADRLDDPIRLRPGFHHEIAAQRLHRLVVDRVGLDERGTGVEAGEPAARHERCRMAVLLVDRPVAVVERVRRLRADVLVERAAQADVDELRAAAEAEHRLLQRHELAQQRDFVIVADAIAVPLGPQRRSRRTTPGQTSEPPISTRPSSSCAYADSVALLPARRVRPSGDGTMKASTSRCISQCATFCSMYCNVIPLKIARLGSS